MNYNLITILGPTATGKTKLAAQTANAFNGEVISADSRQVYKGLDIGTGKDYEDYSVDNKVIKYHLIDVTEPEVEFNLFAYKEEFYKSYQNIIDEGKKAILAGGTGLYLSAIIQNYQLSRIYFNQDELEELEKLTEDELREKLLALNRQLHNSTDLKQKERIINAIIIAKQGGGSIPDYPVINSFNIGIDPGREEVKKRITERLKKRLNEGMVEEVEGLMKRGITAERLDELGLEYRYISKYLKGEMNKNDLFQKLNSAIHNFAKRQMTWFRKMEREGVKIYWLSSPSFEEANKLIQLHNVI
jgi:tRNA dimethylallyltransferase